LAHNSHYFGAGVKSNRETAMKENELNLMFLENL